MLKLRQLQKHVEGHEICKATFCSSCTAATSQMLSYRCRCSCRYCTYRAIQIHSIAHPLCSAFVWELSVDLSTFSGMFPVVYLFQPSYLLVASFFSFFAFFVFDLKHKLLLFVSCFARAKRAVCRLQWLLLCAIVSLFLLLFLLPLSLLRCAPFSVFHLNEISDDSTKQS